MRGWNGPAALPVRWQPGPGLNLHIEAALVFMQGRGSVVEQASLALAFDGQPPAQEAVITLLTGPRADVLRRGGRTGLPFDRLQPAL